MIKKKGSQYCVVHGHDKKAGSKTDKPKGAIIKCHKTKADAVKQHTAIILNQKKVK
jgi:hypothetical protein